MPFKILSSLSYLLGVCFCLFSLQSVLFLFLVLLSLPILLSINTIITVSPKSGESVSCVLKMCNVNHEIVSYTCILNYVVESTLFPMFVPSSPLVPQLVDHIQVWRHQLKFLCICWTLPVTWLSLEFCFQPCQQLMEAFASAAGIHEETGGKTSCPQ